MSHYVPTIESRARFETALESDARQDGVLHQRRDRAKDRAKETHGQPARSEPYNPQTRIRTGKTKWS
jgi:hypothetical protein